MPDSGSASCPVPAPTRRSPPGISRRTSRDDVCRFSWRSMLATPYRPLASARAGLGDAASSGRAGGSLAGSGVPDRAGTSGG